MHTRCTYGMPHLLVECVGSSKYFVVAVRVNAIGSSRHDCTTPTTWEINFEENWMQYM